MYDVNFQQAFYLVGCLLAVSGATYLFYRRRPVVVEEAVVPPEPAEARCLGGCGDFATSPRPSISVPRAGLLPTVFSAPYSRQIHTMVDPNELAFCHNCASLAHAVTDRVLMQKVRGTIAQANEEIAVAVAVFHREGMVAAVRNALGKQSVVEEPAPVRVEERPKLVSLSSLSSSRVLTGTGTE